MTNYEDTNGKEDFPRGRTQQILSLEHEVEGRQSFTFRDSLKELSYLRRQGGNTDQISQSLNDLKGKFYQTEFYQTANPEEQKALEVEAQLLFTQRSLDNYIGQYAVDKVDQEEKSTTFWNHLGKPMLYVGLGALVLGTMIKGCGNEKQNDTYVHNNQTQVVETPRDAEGTSLEDKVVVEEPAPLPEVPKEYATQIPPSIEEESKFDYSNLPTDEELAGNNSHYAAFLRDTEFGKKVTDGSLSKRTN
jgi:hypothetical protein